MHTCGENAVDLKEVENIVVSQNVMYNFQGWSSGDNGGAFISHYGPDYSPKNVWFIFNEVYGVMDGAIFIGGEQNYTIYCIGNLIHDITRPNGKARVLKTLSSKKIYFVNNTIYNCDNGIDSYIDGPLVELHMYNNIIANLKPGGFHLLLSGTEQLKKSVIKNNLYFQEEGQVKFICNKKAYQSLAEFTKATGMDKGSMVANPLFVDPQNRDFRLKAGSPAINKGINPVILEEYKKIFGQDIHYDYKGLKRPQDKLWDIGAIEFK
jgi:hypothetical protein